MSTVVTLAKRNIALTLLVVAALGLLLLNPFFYFGWQSADGRVAELEREEMMANIQLMNAQAKYDLTGLREELQQVLSDIDDLSTSAVIPVEVSFANLDVALGSAASRHGVLVAGLTCDGKVGAEDIGENTYQRFEIDITVTGSLRSINSFLESMEDSAYQSLKFDNVNLTKSEFGDMWQGEVTLVILTQS